MSQEDAVKKRRAVSRDGSEETKFESYYPKTVWHPLSLQHLRPSEFVSVVNSILDGRHELAEGTLKGATCQNEDGSFPRSLPSVAVSLDAI
jgi:hypothetical protein